MISRAAIMAALTCLCSTASADGFEDIPIDVTDLRGGTFTVIQKPQDIAIACSACEDPVIITVRVAPRLDWAIVGPDITSSDDEDRLVQDCEKFERSDCATLITTLSDGRFALNLSYFHDLRRVHVIETHIPTPNREQVIVRSMHPSNGVHQLNQVLVLNQILPYLPQPLEAQQ